MRRETAERHRPKRASSGLSARGGADAEGDVMTLPRQLCENFCSYYKPGKDEELSCLAFVVVGKLMRKGVRIPLKKAKDGNRGSFGDLLRDICPGCPFYEDGCDFAAGKTASEPCGGLLLLGQIMGSGAIYIDDLKNID